MRNLVALVGVFDLCHEGHLNLIKKASVMGDVVVGVVCDKAVKKQKGDNRPFFNEKHRLSIIQSLKGVKKAYIIKDFDIYQLYKKVKDDCFLWQINILVKGEDQGHIKGFDEVLRSEANSMLVTLNRTPNVSSTELIKKLEENTNATNIE